MGHEDAARCRLGAVHLLEAGAVAQDEAELRQGRHERGAGTNASKGDQRSCITRRSGTVSGVARVNGPCTP